MHEKFMREALELARRGLEAVSPNPMVGAVLVRAGRIVARGWHRKFGGPHAEIDALRQVKSARGCDLYVTLEPCFHHGKTPPCTEAILEAGVRRVFYAVGDPFAENRGRGPRRLRREGVEVESGLLREEARRLNRPFFHYVKSGRPWVILKWAMSLDGKIATAERESRWITGRGARSVVHGLRRRVDAILVGTQTLEVDDPLLTARPARGRKPWRIVLDRTGRLSLDLKILQADAPGGPRLYVTSPRADPARLKAIESRGLETLILPEKLEGLDLEYLLSELAPMGISQLLVEGGGGLAGSLVSRGFVDEVVAFVAPKLIGGAEAPGPVGGAGCAHLSEALELESTEMERLGPDILLRGVIRGR